MLSHNQNGCSTGGFNGFLLFFDAFLEKRGDRIQRMSSITRLFPLLFCLFPFDVSWMLIWLLISLFFHFSSAKQDGKQIKKAGDDFSGPWWTESIMMNMWGCFSGVK